MLCNTVYAMYSTQLALIPRLALLCELCIYISVHLLLGLSVRRFLGSGSWIASGQEKEKKREMVVPPKCRVKYKKRPKTTEGSEQHSEARGKRKSEGC